MHRNVHMLAIRSILLLTACLSVGSDANANGLYVDSGGSVGIGTSSPGAYNLNIYGGAGEAQILLESISSQSYDQSITFKDPGGQWVVGNRFQTQTNDFGIGQDYNKTNLIITSAGDVGINMYPTYDLDVVGIIRSSVGMAVTAFTNTTWDYLCVSAGGGMYRCGLSSKRHKEGVKDFTDGLELITKLHPVSFYWKDKETYGKAEDVGLVAEEVAEVNPALTYSKDGAVEGIHYQKLTMYLINAVKQQQRDIDDLRKQVETLSRK